MLIDAVGVRHDDAENPRRRASGDVRWAELRSGHFARGWPTIETPVVTEDAFRLSVRLHEILSALHSQRDEEEALYGDTAVLVLAEPVAESSNVGEAHLATVTPEGPERSQLESRLWWAFESEPLEDGMDHPADRLLAEHLNEDAETQTLEWIRDWCMDTMNATFAASVLQCVARQLRPGTASWRTELVRGGLATQQVEIRDAAAKAADAWKDSELLAILQGHTEPVPWLADFIRDVVADWD